MKKRLKKMISIVLCTALLLPFMTTGAFAAPYIADIQAVQGSSLAIMSDGSVWGWGEGTYTSLSHKPGDAVRNTPQKMLTGNYVQLDMYNRVTDKYDRYLTADGVLTCTWGDGYQMTNVASYSGDFVLKKDGTLWRMEFGEPVLIGSNVAKYGEGAYVKTDGSLLLYGWDENCVVAGVDQFTEPYRLMDGVADIVADQYNLFVLMKNGDLYGYGDNLYSQLGQGNNQNILADGERCLILQNVSAIEGGGCSMLAIKQDGSLWAWGRAHHGVLGVGESYLHYDDTMYYYWRGEVSVPTKVMDNVSKVSHGNTHTLILKKDGTVWACGANDAMQIGDGVKPALSQWTNYEYDSLSPVQIPFSTSLGQQQTKPTPTLSYNNDEITLVIGSTTANVFGNKVITDASPMIRNGSTMLPIRFVAEALGATVGWNEANQAVVIQSDDKIIEITINADYAYINGEQMKLNTPAFIENGRTYLPVRFVSEALGATVNWNAETQSVSIIPEK